MVRAKLDSKKHLPQAALSLSGSAFTAWMEFWRG
jgi:hypothetical protein